MIEIYLSKEPGMGNTHRSRGAAPTLARLPPLTALRAFVATAKHLSFNRAADELHVTPAAVGQQVRLLEDHLGQLLFNRDRGQLHLTAAGHALTPGLTQAFEGVVESLLRLATGDGNTIRISVAPSFAAKWLIPRLSQLSQLAPELHIHVDATPQLVDIAGDEADCVIRYGAGRAPGLLLDKLFDEDVLPLCSPEFARRHALIGRPEAIADVPLVHDEGPEQDPACPDWSAWLRLANLPARLGKASLAFNQSALVIDAAIAGNGLALAKLRLAEADLAAGLLLSPFGTPWPSGSSYYFMTTPQKARLEPIQILRRWLLAEARSFRDLPATPWDIQPDAPLSTPAAPAPRQRITIET